MGAAVTVDVAGGPMGGAARFRLEFYNYLEGTGRKDIGIIGANRRLDPAWLMRREMVGHSRARRVALNNVGFVAPGGERWTLLGNALHFLTGQEISALDPSLPLRCQSLRHGHSPRDGPHRGFPTSPHRLAVPHCVLTHCGEPPA